MHIKYNSIDNHYITKNINWSKEYYKHIIGSTKFSVTEKIHGANISFYFTPNNPVKIFSRNQEIIGFDFQKASEVIQKTIANLFSIQNYVDKNNYTVRLFGEVFGKGIQKGVDYGSCHRIRFFDVMLDDLYKCQQDAEEFMKLLNLLKYFTNILGIFDTLDDALAFNEQFDSTYNDIEDNICEGIVIKPYNNVLIDQNGVMFYLKKKNEKFIEKAQMKARNKKEVRAEAVFWHNEFLCYIHKERLESVFSKEGRIESVREIGKFIPLITQDATETFLTEENEFPKDDFSTNELKFIFNGGREIALLLKEEL